LAQAHFGLQIHPQIEATAHIGLQIRPQIEATIAPMSEKTPLVDKSNTVLDHIYEAYGLTESHATFSKSFNRHSEVLVDYTPLKFSTLRVFWCTKGTILKDPTLLVEQALTTLLFLAFAAPVYIYFGSDLGANRHGAVSVRVWLDTQEGKMRAFAMIMTMLAAFLLTIYTSMAVNRWWTIRAGGVGGIKAATVELEMYIYQLVTQEPEVLDAIRRYGRTSLMLIFLWRRGELCDMKEQMVSHGLLLPHEADQLLTWDHCLHETIWAWQAGIVTMLYKEGKIKSDQIFNLLLDRCSKGRAAVQLAHTHVAVRIPMQYVHLLGLLVKMHNSILAMIMGILFGAAIRNGETIICIQLFGRTLILPFLFNAILLINAELSDPFDGSESDFPGDAYQKTLDKDCQSIVMATNNMPDWLAARSGFTGAAAHEKM